MKSNFAKKLSVNDDYLITKRLDYESGGVSAKEFIVIDNAEDFNSNDNIDEMDGTN